MWDFINNDGTMIDKFYTYVKNEGILDDLLDTGE